MHVVVSVSIGKACAQYIRNFPIVALETVPMFVWLNTVSVSASAQDGIAALGKAHTRSARSLSSLPVVALEKLPIFARLKTDHS